MGQKVRPTGFRTGIMQTWLSAWYANKQDYSELLVEDFRVRAFVQKYLTRSRDRKEQRPAIAKIAWKDPAAHNRYASYGARLVEHISGVKIAAGE